MMSRSRKPKEAPQSFETVALDCFAQQGVHDLRFVRSGLRR